MANPQQTNGCTHQWRCICMDASDELHRCAVCGLMGDGHGCTWMVKPHRPEVTPPTDPAASR
jgi:hypothetical protein